LSPVITVKGVRARRHLIRNRTLRQTVLRGEGRPLDTKFVHHLVRRIKVGLHSRGFGLRCGDTVKDDLSLKVDTTINALGEGGSLHTRSKEDELVNLTTPATANLSRKSLDYLILDCRSKLRLARIQRDQVGGYLDDLVGAACLQRYVDRGLDADLNIHLVPHCLAEARSRHADCVAAR
jgi:hypothetical protein